MMLVQHEGASYLQKIIPSVKEEDPLAKVMQMLCRANTASYQLIRAALNTDVTTICENGLDKLKVGIKGNITSSKLKSKLSLHRLKIETGQWSQIQRENCLCSCGNNMQDENHVLVVCVQEGYS